MESMYYIGLDVHKKMISYCVKDRSGKVHSEGRIPATRYDMDRWMNSLPPPLCRAVVKSFRMNHEHSQKVDVRFERVHQILQTVSRTMGSPFLHPNALANSDIFERGPFVRNRGSA